MTEKRSNPTRSEAAAYWEYAQRHFGRDSREAEEAGEVLQETLTLVLLPNEGPTTSCR